MPELGNEVRLSHSDFIVWGYDNGVVEFECETVDPRDYPELIKFLQNQYTVFKDWDTERKKNG